MLPVSVQVSRPDVPGSKGSTYAHTVSSNSFFPSTSSFKLFVSCIFLFFLLLHELLERWSILYVDCWDTRRDKATTTASSRGFRSLSRSPCCWHKEWKTRLQQAASIFLICSSAGWLAGQWTPPSNLLPNSIPWCWPLQFRWTKVLELLWPTARLRMGSERGGILLLLDIKM